MIQKSVLFPAQKNFKGEKRKKNTFQISMQFDFSGMNVLMLLERKRWKLLKLLLMMLALC
jgi:hypothetical protein